MPYCVISKQYNYKFSQYTWWLAYFSDLHCIQVYNVHVLHIQVWCKTDYIA